MYILTTALLLTLTTTISAECYHVSPAFPLADWSNGKEDLRPAFQRIVSRLDWLMSIDMFNPSSFSIELTSSTETLWGAYHTAKVQNTARPGDTRVDWDSVYRIASITKVFTTLGILQQHAAGNLSLDDPISNYIPELSDPNNSGAIPWKDITLRILASQLSGIPREFAQSDLINRLPNPTDHGLPPATKEGLPECDEYDSFVHPCNRTDFLSALKRQHPLFAPNQRSTYSNQNFELLGLALENVTGMPYAEYIHSAILSPLNMTSTTLATPKSDDHAVLPIGNNYWDVDEGVQSPTGGIYSSAADMSKFLRYVLTHYNALATGVNWFNPASFSSGLQNFYGMPFEIFRSDEVLEESRRPVTFVTKGGSLRGYYSEIVLLEQYGLGFTFLVSGTPETGPKLLKEVQEIVVGEFVREAERAVWKGVGERYAGRYVAEEEGLNSSVVLSASPSRGLVVESFISNGSDILNGYLASAFSPAVDEGKPWRMQLTPTLLFANESSRQGEKWRTVVLLDRQEGDEKKVFGESCLADVDSPSYAGKAINEVVFWREEGVIELPAWQVKLRKQELDESEAFQSEGEETWKTDL